MDARETTGFANAESSALVAQFGSESRLNPNHFQASAFGFVLDEALKLEKAPVAHPVVHTLSKSSSSDSFEVFQHYPSTIKARDYALAYVVINPSHEPLLSATQLPEKLFRRASAFGLKNRTQMLKLPLNLLNFRRVVEHTIARDSEIVNSEVNAENTLLRSVVNGISLFRKSEQKISLFPPVNSKQALGQLPTFEALNVTGWNFDDEFLTAFDGSDSQDIAFQTSGAWEIISNTCFLNYWLSLGFLDQTASLPYASY